MPFLLLLRNYIWTPLLVWINLGFYTCLFVILSLAHFEVRYFYLVKIFSANMFMLLACFAWKERGFRRHDVRVGLGRLNPRSSNDATS